MRYDGEGRSFWECTGKFHDVAHHWRLLDLWAVGWPYGQLNIDELEEAALKAPKGLLYSNREFRELIVQFEHVIVCELEVFNQDDVRFARVHGYDGMFWVEEDESA